MGATRREPAQGRFGISRTTLHRRTKSGEYVRIARGVYLPSDSDPSDPELVEASARRPDATICLISALAHHGLTDQIPRTLDIAIRRGSRRPTTDSAITWHVFDAATFDIGRDTLDIPGTQMTIGVHSPERAIADAFRLRRLVGYETARDSLKQWLAAGGKPAALAQIAARLPRAKRPVMDALEILA